MHPPSAAPTLSRLPSPLPTVSPLPTQTPTPLPSTSFVPTPVPTLSPSPVPSSPPSGETRAAFQLSIGLSGLSCGNYGAAEETLVNKALTRVVSGVSTASFGAHICSGSNDGRRALRSTDSTITILMSVDEAQVIIGMLLSDEDYCHLICFFPSFLPAYSTTTTYSVASAPKSRRLSRQGRLACSLRRLRPRWESQH